MGGGTGAGTGGSIEIDREIIRSPDAESVRVLQNTGASNIDGQWNFVDNIIRIMIIHYYNMI